MDDVAVHVMTSNVDISNAVYCALTGCNALDINIRSPSKPPEHVGNSESIVTI